MVLGFWPEISIWDSVSGFVKFGVLIMISVFGVGISVYDVWI